MKILLTGANSFVGSSLYPMLLKQGHEVYSISRKTCSRKNNFVGDLSDPIFYEKLPINIDVVIHLAAVTSPPEYDAAKLYVNNTEATRLLVKYCKQIKISKFIYASSVSIYGDVETTELQESTVINSPSPYGLSKFIGEILLKESALNFSSVSLRLPAIIGKGATRHFLSRVVDSIAQDKIIDIFNPESMFNNCIHVENLNEFIVDLIAKNFCGNHSFNVSASDPISIVECIETLSCYLNKISKTLITPLDKTSFLINSDLAKNFGFMPWSVEKSLQKWIN